MFILISMLTTLTGKKGFTKHSKLWPTHTCQRDDLDITVGGATESPVKKRPRFSIDPAASMFDPTQRSSGAAAAESNESDQSDCRTGHLTFARWLPSTVHLRRFLLVIERLVTFGRIERGCTQSYKRKE